MTDKEETKKDEKKEETADSAPAEEKKEEAVSAPTPKEEKKEEAVPAAEEKKTDAQPAGEDPSTDSPQQRSGQAGQEVEVPAKFKKLVEEIEKMTVIELNELVKVFEKKFGVSAQAVAVAPAGGAGGGDEGEEQDSFTVELKSVGDKKIAVIKAIKEILGLGLKDAKDITDGAPSTIKEDVNKAEAEEIKKKIEEAGGTVELK